MRETILLGFKKRILKKYGFIFVNILKIFTQEFLIKFLGIFKNGFLKTKKRGSVTTTPPKNARDRDKLSTCQDVTFYPCLLVFSSKGTLGMSNNSLQENQPELFSPEKNDFQTSNFDNFIGKSRFIPVPQFLSRLGALGILSKAEFDSFYNLWEYCFLKNYVSFALTLPKLAEVMLCSRQHAKTVIKKLKANNALLYGREKLNAGNHYQWNVELWITGEGVGQNLAYRRTKNSLPSAKIQPTVGQNLAYVYIEEYLLEYLIKISLKIVSDHVRRHVDKFPELLTQSGLQKGELSLVFYCDQKVALWSRAICEVIPPKWRYLAVLMFEEENLDFGKIEYPDQYLKTVFQDSEIEHRYQKAHSYQFQNQNEYFELNRVQLNKQLPIPKGE